MGLGPELVGHLTRANTSQGWLAEALAAQAGEEPCQGQFRALPLCGGQFWHGEWPSSPAQKGACVGLPPPHSGGAHGPVLTRRFLVLFFGSAQPSSWTKLTGFFETFPPLLLYLFHFAGGVVTSTPSMSSSGKNLGSDQAQAAVWGSAGH